MSKKLRIAMVAPPWLKIPPAGYGGIEAVVFELSKELAQMGHDVELFSIKPTKVPGVKVHYLYEDEQYQHIHKPLYESMPIPGAHMQFAIDYIRKKGNFDIIHDHNGFIGLPILKYANADPNVPPSIHTIHGPPFSDEARLKKGIPDNNYFWEKLGSAKRFYLVGISKALMKKAPKQLDKITLDPVHNALNTNDFEFKSRKQPYFLTLARFSEEKGQHIAARICDKRNLKLRMAGTVAGISTPNKLQLEIANPLSDYRYAADFKYYSDNILPISVNNTNIRYIGNISGQEKISTLSNAKALLFPIQWDEPFGMAVIESLACGTPVIAMNRGAMPEIIDHGVNGFLADNEKQFEDYMTRIEEIDPKACRDSVEKRFSSNRMAKKYSDRYFEVIQKSKN